MPAESGRASHWDLMLQYGNSLATWELLQPLDASAQVDARRLPDHRLEYLTYEGPISRGRGIVRCVDRGNYVRLRCDDECWQVILHGNRFHGLLELVSCPEGSYGWRVSFRPAPPGTDATR